jgi:hypothetical protein
MIAAQCWRIKGAARPSGRVINDLGTGTSHTEMTQEKAPEKASPAMQPETTRNSRKPKPEWTQGLRQLYDSVLNESLPDSFADLISKLDESGK